MSGVWLVSRRSRSERGKEISHSSPNLRRYENNRCNFCHRQGDQEALETIVRTMGGLIELYPEHIKKEDDVFFPASMAYLSTAEQETMVEEMQEVDRQMIHKKYQSVVQRLKDQRLGI